MGESLPPVAAVLPHRGAMMLLSEVLEHSDEHTACAVDIGADTPFADADGTVPALVAVEYMAQCVAAHAGLRAWAKGEPARIGFLIGSRRLDFKTLVDFRVGQRLVVRVTRTWGEEEFAMFACRLIDSESDRVLVEGHLNVFLPRSIDPFLAVSS